MLRDYLDLSSTRNGCGIAQCDECTIQLDGVAVHLCSISVSTLGDKAITTIEGISENGDHPVQQA